MFQVVALPFDAYRSLPPQEFKLLAALSRYADRSGGCFPTLRQLARDAVMSLATTWRAMNRLSERGCFTRTRRGRGRFVYQLAEPFRLRWPERVSPSTKHGVSQVGTQEAKPSKHEEGAPARRRFAKDGRGTPASEVAAVSWGPRLRAWERSRFWLPFWGPKPNDPSCWAPAELLIATNGV